MISIEKFLNMTLIKKYICAILTVSFFHYTGCYSHQQIQRSDVKTYLDENAKEEITIRTTDFKEYHFDRLMYAVRNDTVLGTGELLFFNSSVPFQGKIALDDIVEIRVKETDALGSIFTAIGILTIGVLTAVIASVAVETSN
ncbi:MAG: hypothetical protein IPM14_04460 [bacterium]|nr:hypothetical protein [bacterium]